MDPTKDHDRGVDSGVDNVLSTLQSTVVDGEPVCLNPETLRLESLANQVNVNGANDVQTNVANEVQSYVANELPPITILENVRAKMIFVDLGFFNGTENLDSPNQSVII